MRLWRAWPRSGSISSGTCSRRPRSGHPIDENASSCWPTVTASDGNSRTIDPETNREGSPSLTGQSSTWATSWPTATAQDSASSGSAAYPETSGRHADTTLTDAIRMWPTPTADAYNDGEAPENWLARRERNKAKGYNGNGQGTPLAMAARMRATPMAMDGVKPSAGNRRKDDLSHQIQMWATPSAQMWRSENPDQSPEHSPPLSRQVLRIDMPGSESSPSTQTSRPRLNPAFVEWLMGLPLGWADPMASLEVTTYEHWEMESYRLLRQLRSTLSLRGSAW